ncbi:MAG TPA: hypothetical protein VK002_06275 [Rubricoccaceae bacterium]|nr:hypothetical protein [Rubricoccaceae bacterium]
MGNEKHPRLGLLALTFLALLISACARPDALSAPDEEPLVRGPIASITTHATGTGILVEAGPGSREPCGILATADAETRYLRRTGAGTLLQAELADLAVGDTVEVYVEGPVAESCPVQGYASAVVLVSSR